MKKNKYEIDMCNGTIMDKLISFSLPLMVSGILQLMFNAVDIIVVGRFSGSQALAAVGSTTALINVFINLFMGISLGANVLAARYYAAGRDREMSETVHTSIMLALISGVVMAFVGVFFAKGALELMDTPADVIDQSALYMRIYFMGMPFFMLYNYGAAILRAVGDTKRPLYFLIVSGVINAGLNMFLVIVFSLGVAGVAIATVVSQAISCVLVLRCLYKSEGSYQLRVSKLCLKKDYIIPIFQVGIPAGIQSTVINFSNVLLQSSVNSFGSIAMAGNTASQNIEGFVYTSMNALYQTNLSFTSQNIGAEKYTRIKKILATCQGVVVTVGLVLGFAAYLGGPWLLQIYSEDADVISYGLLRMSIICTTYFLCGVMDTMVGSIRGLGYSILPTLVSLTGACGLRVIWIFTIFAAQRSLAILYLSYPISWAVTATAHMICFWRAAKKLPKEDGHPVRG